jgi:hypothetical protein
MQAQGDSKMNTRQRFETAYRIRRLMKHKYACSAELKKFDDFGMLRLALKCTFYPPGYFTSGGLHFSKQAAKNGYSFKKAVKMYLRAVKYRMGARHARNLAA